MAHDDNTISQMKNLETDLMEQNSDKEQDKGEKGLGRVDLVMIDQDATISEKRTCGGNH